jgi:ribokinase
VRIIVAGNVNVDLIMGRVAPWPQPGSEIIVDQYQLRVGGSLGNTALALQALGADVEYFANVGDDALGIWLRQELESKGCLLAQTPGPTAVTVGLSHPDGERTFVTYGGHLDQKISHGDIFLLCGYFLVPALRVHALSLVQEVSERGGRILLDTGWPTAGWTSEVRKEVQALLPFCDFFLPNREELCSLSMHEDIVQALEATASKMSGQIIVKMGEDGAGYLDQHQLRQFQAPSVEVWDTVGAGDTFNATFIYGLSRCKLLQTATQLAVRAASFAVSSQPRRYLTPKELESVLLT